MSHRKLPFGFRLVPQILNLGGTSLDRRGGYKGGYAHRAFPNRCFRATGLKLRVLRETSGPCDRYTQHCALFATPILGCNAGRPFA